MLPQDYNNYQKDHPYQKSQDNQSFQNYQTSQNYQFYQNNLISQNYQPQPTYKINNYRQQEVDNIPGPNFEILDTALLNVAKSLCKIKIETNKGFFFGSGFFLKLLIN